MKGTFVERDRKRQEKRKVKGQEVAAAAAAAAAAKKAVPGAPGGPGLPGQIPVSYLSLIAVVEAALSGSFFFNVFFF